MYIERLDPMPPIMRPLKKLASGEVMLVKHMWEPQPLYDIWNKQGVEYYAEQKSAEEWWIYLRWKVQENRKYLGSKPRHH